MKPKLIFLDLDGTIIDHTINDVPTSTETAIAALKKNGHTVVIATGRPPALFYGIDKRLGINTYIAANGRFVRHENMILYHDYMHPDSVDRFVRDMEEREIDVAFESIDDYVVNRHSSDLVEKFSANFNLKVPRVVENFHLTNRVLQMVMFYNGKDFSEISEAYPEFDFNISCKYGVDINARGGMKEIGMNVLCNHLGFNAEDTIAVGDGYNDISMIMKAGVGIAMGNACEPLKAVADYVADDCSKDGLFKIFKTLGYL